MTADDGIGARASVERASGETQGPWLAILRRSVLTSVAGLAVVSAIAAFMAGMSGWGSSLFGGALVIVFFGVSLLIGHWVGNRNPSAALGAFMVGYAVKVVLLGVLAFTFGAPVWLDGVWFLLAVVVVVVLWQAAELLAFSRLRFQLFADPVDGAAPGRPSAGNTRVE